MVESKHHSQSLPPELQPKTVVKFNNKMTPPKSWIDSGFDEGKIHYHVQDAEETDDGDAYRLITVHTDQDWFVSRTQVQAVRPPGHPGHPKNI
jgi:hypothetical protein